jgi:hypothetical protein
MALGNPSFVLCERVMDVLHNSRPWWVDVIGKIPFGILVAIDLEIYLWPCPSAS